MKIELIKRIAKNRTAKNILVIGVFHGDEEQGEFLINKFLKEVEMKPRFSTEIDNMFKQNATLKEGNVQRLEAIKNAFRNAYNAKQSSMPKKNNIYYIPRLNSEKTRVNANKVDLNRNFPTENWISGEGDEYFGGTAPQSEEETKFLVKLINEVKFNAVFSIHAPYKIVNYDGPAEELALAVSKIVEYPVQKDIGYPTTGSFGTYLGVERNIPVITIEVDEEVPVESLYPKFKKLFDYLEDQY